LANKLKQVVEVLFFFQLCLFVYLRIASLTDLHDRIRAVKNWRFWLGVAISLFFLGWVLKDLLPELDQFWVALRTANYWWILPGIFVYFLGVWARAWRWHYLLRKIKAVPTRTMFPIVAIGYMGNNIYPARAGELLRAVVLKRREGVAISASLATIIVERIFDGVVMLAFVFINIPELTRLTGGSGIVGTFSIRQVAIWGSVLFFGALLVFLIDVWMVFLTSVVIWLFETGKYWFVMHAFSFQVSFFALMLMNGIVNLATTLPSAPGYIGTFDKPGIAVLVAYGVNMAVATSYTIVLHIALWVPITALGAYYLWREGIRWEEAAQEREGT